MEEVGAQVAAPLYMPSLFCESGSMAKKRNIACQISEKNFQHQLHHNPSLNKWNPESWSWDSVKFMAKPLDPDILLLGTPPPSQQQSKHDVHINHHFTSKSHEEEEALRLNLGGVLNAVEEPVSRPNKRLRSGSPGTNSYPMCQVDNCKEDLSSAKDYHRRHKVCELHSKSFKALVGKQMQRFCQQCSRFHLLLEFDEGKRSCRRRLAGHNRRRRKTQSDDTSSHLILPGKQDTQGNENLDLVKLLTAITHSQGKNEDRSVNYPTSPDRDQLMQIISKINSFPFPMDLAEKLSNIGSLSRKMIDQPLSEYQSRLHGSVPSSSTMDLLNVRSTTLPAPAPNSVAILPERSSQSSDSDKSKVTSSDQVTDPHQQRRPPLGSPSAVGERARSCYQSPTEDSDLHITEVRPTLPLQLFSSSLENESPTKEASSVKNFSSDSSNPIEEKSPSASPPFLKKLFPLRSNAETIKSEKTSIHGEIAADIKGAEIQGCALPLALFRGPSRGNGNDAFQSFPHQGGYTSSPGSDHSPPSQSSEAQDRTGRIMFKLFDKDPSHLPQTLRMQIYNWLSSSPSEMESYIRPGCVLLSIYVAMSSSTWEQLDRKMPQQVDSLVQNSDSDLWTGRFILQIGRQLASHKDGRIHLCKAWSSWSSPELISISPLAVVSGQETSLLLRGRNLTNPGTKVFCTDNGGYTSLKVTASTYPESTYDVINVGDFKILESSPNALGRCFVEVENGFKGTSFPLIIADDAICKELRLLEPELDEDTKTFNNIPEELAYDLGPPNSREQVLLFLNEIGWLFQRKRCAMSEIPYYSLDRFKFLLVFSVARDYCVLVKIILDMLVERNTDGSGLSRKSLETVSDLQLLNRAIKRRCRKMVELLINYSVKGNDIFSKQYIFMPNLVGPGGITPLHLAACTSGSEEMVDALTNDPNEIGLSCWKTLLDACGHSPYDYAIMTQNHSYNKLVSQKLADRGSRQISVIITDEAEQPLSAAEQVASDSQQGWRSCEKCATAAAKYYCKIQVSQGLLQRPYIHSMLAIAAVCACVCLFLRGEPNLGLIAPFKWENLDYGTM